MNTLYSKINGFYKSHSSQQILSFTSALTDFKTAYENLVSIKEPLEILQKTFSQDIKLPHPREIYPIYESLNVVTNEVAKSSLSTLRSSWEQVLKTLHHRKIYRIGLGPAYFTTTFAQQILNNKQQTAAISSVDVKNEENRQEVIDYVYQIDREAFGSCFQKGFLNEILKSDRIRCFVARNEKNKIVGILWGFFTQCQDKELFHFWELSRKASMAQMGIARGLIDYAKQQQNLYPNLKFTTLNVDIENKHAKEIYDNEHFAALNTEEKKATKIFMVNHLDTTAALTIESAKTIVKKFVIETVPLHKLLYYELLRRCELIWRKCWYR